MFRSRENITSLRALLARFAGSDKTARDGAIDDQSIVAKAIHQRAINGITTTLRQLHKVTDLAQPGALRAVSELERLELVVIDRNIHDALESTVTLTDKIRDELDKAEKNGAA